jgi:GMP synthase (glutamine-hydrolysing)
MKRLLIIKTGSSLPGLVSRWGDFDDWIIAAMQIGMHRTMVVDVTRDDILPDYDDVFGVVITGSHTRVTEHQPWSERTAAWLPGAVDGDLPILGIGYGHQLLAYAAGGTVEDNPNGMEFGSVEVHLRAAARNDALFRDFSDPLHVQSVHVQSVTHLPAGARLLASSELDSNQAFRLGTRAWGIQFHPEFNVEIVLEYIQHYQRALEEQGTDPAALVRRCRSAPHGEELLRRFAHILETQAGA